MTALPKYVGNLGACPWAGSLGFVEGVMRHLSILPGVVYKSDAKTAEVIAGPGGPWRRAKLRGVINTAGEINLSYDPILPALKIPVQEMGPTPGKFFDQIVEFAMRFRPVLVHCQAGRNRSAAGAIAIVVAMGEDPRRAIKSINPNLPP